MTVVWEGEKRPASRTYLIVHWSGRRRQSRLVELASSGFLLALVGLGFLSHGLFRDYG